LPTRAVVESARARLPIERFDLGQPYLVNLAVDPGRCFI
jgi:hypothetical protein